MRLFGAVFCLAGALTAQDLPEGPAAALDRILSGGPPRFDDAFVLADIRDTGERRFTEFSGDLSGRYLDALSAARVDLDRVRGLTQEIAALQREDGGVGRSLSEGPGATDDDMARLWGAGRLLVGLVEAHRAGAGPEALAAARRLGDWLVGVAPRFQAESVRREFQDGHLATGYICWTQNIEGLAMLHVETGDAAYLDVARQIAAHVERRPGQHSHGLLASARGLLALHQINGDDRHLADAQALWEDLKADPDAMPLPGAVAEYLSSPPERDEGCSNADWLRLNILLWEDTRDPRYLDELQRSYFNGFRANRQGGGDFGHVRFSPAGLEPGGSAAWWCCTLHGARAGVPLAASSYQALDGGGTRIEWPLGGEGGADLRVRMSRLTPDGRVDVEVIAAPEQSADLEIRIPAWSVGVALSIDSVRDGDVQRARRLWRAGERLTIDYRPQVRWEDSSRAGYAEAWRGPFLMGVSEDSAPQFFQEPHEHNRIDFDSWDGETLSYQPAGYPEQPATVRLTPLGERGPLRFESRFLREPEAARAERTREKVRSIWTRAAPALLGAAFGAIIALLLVAIRRRRG